MVLANHPRKLSANDGSSTYRTPARSGLRAQGLTRHGRQEYDGCTKPEGPSPAWMGRAAQPEGFAARPGRVGNRVHSQPIHERISPAPACQQCSDPTPAQVRGYRELACTILCGSLRVPLRCRLRLGLPVCQLLTKEQSETAKRVLTW